MKITIDTDAGSVCFEDQDGRREVPLYSTEAFAALTRQWVKVGWQLKYSYGFTWMGRPIIQLPEDILRVQETIHRVRPDVVIETGVAHGGSLILYASLFAAMGRGRVVGIDIEIRPHNRTAIEHHELGHLITLIEGSSVDPAIVERVRALLRPGERVLVILDSDHSRGHVAAELDAYAPLVSLGSYIIAADGIMEDLADVPRGRAGWVDDNPAAAVRAFALHHPEFILETPPFLFAESDAAIQATYWPAAYLRRRVELPSAVPEPRVVRP